jgi:LuxR family transcriptional regulator, maltose regulon positive regulatory protein
LYVNFCWRTSIRTILTNSRRPPPRAQEWLLARNRVDVAIDLRLDIGDIDGAAVLIDQFARLFMRHYGLHLTFLQWCNKIPNDQLRRYPRVQSLRVWALNILRRYDEADIILVELEDGLRTTVPLEQRSEEARSLRRLVDLEQCVKLVVRDQWLPLETAARSWIGRWTGDAEPLHLGMAHVMVGCGAAASSDFDEALTEIRIGRKLIAESQAHYCLAWTQMWMAAILTMKCQYRQALAECDDAIVQIACHLGGRTPAELMLQALRALLLYENNQLEEASEALENGLTALVEQSSVDSLIAGYVTLARILAGGNQHLEAGAILAEGEAIGWRHDLPRLAVALGAERTDLLLKQGQLGPARALWEELQQRVDSPVLDSVARVIGQRALTDKTGRIEARMLMVSGNAISARDLIAACVRHAIQKGQKHKVVEMLLLQARAYLHAHDRNAAFALLQEAIDIGIVQGYVRVFVYEDIEIRDMLQSRLDGRPAPALREYLKLLIGAFQGNAAASATTEPYTSESFTRRELKIIARLSSGMNNRELANALFITEGTLKWHLKNIYSKLGVASRVSAINAAKALGIQLD